MKQTNMKKKKQPKGVGRVIGDGRRSLSITQTPASSEISLRDGTYLSIAKKGTPSGEYGPAVRFEGRQSFANVTTTAADNQLFVSSGGATITSINSVLVSPDLLNVNLALIARNYTRYVFRRLRFIFITRVATTQTGGCVLSYTSDGDQTAFVTNSYASLQSLIPNVIFPFRKTVEVLDVSYTGTRTWFTEADTATAAGIRQSVQGALLGFPDISSIGAVLQGEILVEYVVDLYQPASDYGFTMIASKIKRPIYSFYQQVQALLEDEKKGAFLKSLVVKLTLEPSEMSLSQKDSTRKLKDEESSISGFCKHGTREGCHLCRKP